MREQRFTPGPWHYGHAGTEALWVGPDHNRTPVAHVDHDMEYARENSRANARLISSAPELLDALIEAKSEMRDWGPDHPVMRQIDAAIAKAEGRS